MRAFSVMSFADVTHMQILVYCLSWTLRARQLQLEVPQQIAFSASIV